MNDETGGINAEPARARLTAQRLIDDLESQAQTFDPYLTEDLLQHVNRAGFWNLLNSKVELLDRLDSQTLAENIHRYLLGAQGFGPNLQAALAVYPDMAGALPEHQPLIQALSRWR